MRLNHLLGRAKFFIWLSSQYLCVSLLQQPAGSSSMQNLMCSPCQLPVSTGSPFSVYWGGTIQDDVQGSRAQGPSWNSFPVLQDKAVGRYRRICCSTWECADCSCMDGEEVCKMKAVIAFLFVVLSSVVNVGLKKNILTITILRKKSELCHSDSS